MSKKPRGRPFEPGNQFGRGRPKGSRNKKKALGEDLLEQYGEAIYRKCIAEALKGERSAMREMMQRVSPVRRDAGIHMNLPPIRSAEDLEGASQQIFRAVRRGEITPLEGESVMRMLESRSRLLEASVERRVDRLEMEREGVQSESAT